MKENQVIPRDAAALILLKNPQDPFVYWVKRSLRLQFMGGYQAFPGGQRDPQDAEIPVLSCADPEAAAMRVCAIRELFEETGVLIARGVERLSSLRLIELRNEFEAGKIGFAALLEREGLTIDGTDLIEAPRWITPPPAPKRFNTFFYVAWLPSCADGEQEAIVHEGELQHGEWCRPHEAVERWRRGEVLMAPPVLVPLLEMEKGLDGFVARLHQSHGSLIENVPVIQFRYGFNMIPLRTPTIPPATQTNCFLIGQQDLVVIDPGSPYPEEQQKLDDVIENFLAEGRYVREILITHLHPDHTGGVTHLARKFQLPVAAHRLTAEAISETVHVDRFIEDQDLIDLGGDPGWKLRAIWSPGHARGHLSFYEERTGSLITGDCVVGFGTVVIAPPEGNMKAYLASLARYLELPKLTALFPAHGPVLADASGKINEYIAHRLEREVMILRALRERAATVPELVKKIYTDVPASLHKYAELSVLAHLEKLQEEHKVNRAGDVFSMV